MKFIRKLIKLFSSNLSAVGPHREERQRREVFLLRRIEDDPKGEVGPEVGRMVPHGQRRQGSGLRSSKTDFLERRKI